jgi:hypothetical protein
MMVKSKANEKTQTLSLYSIIFQFWGVILKPLINGRSLKIRLNLRLKLRLDEGYFLQDNQCTLAFPKYLLHVLNDMQAKQLAGTNMSKLVTSGARHLEIL